jgi:murein DD-endopeptidase MepM/ murein hydrolase activator NlpD
LTGLRTSAMLACGRKESRMSSFDVDISNPFPEPDSMTGQFFGPGAGGHIGPNWFEAFGNDLGARTREPVHSVCAGQVTRIDRTHLAPETFATTVYGAGVFIQATSDVLQVGAPGGVSCFYTHIDLAPRTTEGARVVRGQVLGSVLEAPDIPPHLHFAIAERIAGRAVGVDIFERLVDTANTPTVTRLTFFQDGRPPESAAGLGA